MTPPPPDVRCEGGVHRCAHYDDGTSDPENGQFSVGAGTCLFSTRNWSEACTPNRCFGCPEGAIDDLTRRAVRRCEATRAAARDYGRE